MFKSIFIIFKDHFILLLMDNLFNQIYEKLIQDENNEGDICNICHLKVTKNEIKLECSHVFHKKCLKKKIGKCPYCDKKYDITNKDKLETIPNNTCKVILKSGKNKGKECGRINCGYHKNKDNIII